MINFQVIFTDGSCWDIKPEEFIKGLLIQPATQLTNQQQ